MLKDVIKKKSTSKSIKSKTNNNKKNKDPN